MLVRTFRSFRFRHNTGKGWATTAVLDLLLNGTLCLAITQPRTRSLITILSLPAYQNDLKGNDLMSDLLHSNFAKNRLQRRRYAHARAHLRLASTETSRAPRTNPARWAAQQNNLSPLRALCPFRGGF